MSSRSLWKRKSFLFFIALIAILIVLAPFSLANTDVSHMDIKQISKYDNGSTVFAGDELIDNTKVNKYPLAINLNYLGSQILSGDLIGGVFSIMTGTVPVPASELVSGNVSDNGLVADFSGPGYIEFKNNTIFVHSPKNMVWGYNDPYTQAEKTAEGIDIINVRTNQTIEHIDGDNINNDTIKEEYLVSGDTIKYWYDHARQGARYTLEYSVAGINDGRSYIPPAQLRENFNDAYEYSVHYPAGAPIVIYNANPVSKVVSSSYTYLGDHSEYGNDNREHNSKQFCIAWNNTIIPANSTSCGKDGVGFTAVHDAEAEGGSATHGVCPAARAMRNSLMALGIPLPVGMDSGQDAVLFGYSPSTGIKVTNTLDYPIKIVMWTEGSGTDMVIYSKIYQVGSSESANSTS